MSQGNSDSDSDSDSDGGGDGGEEQEQPIGYEFKPQELMPAESVRCVPAAAAVIPAAPR